MLNEKHSSETSIGTCVLVSQSCQTLCDCMDCSPPGSSVHGISQASILERVAYSPPGDLPDPGTEPGSPALEADSLPSDLPGKSILSVHTHVNAQARDSKHTHTHTHTGMHACTDIHTHAYFSLVTALLWRSREGTT